MIWYLIVILTGGIDAGDNISVTQVANQRACEFIKTQIKEMKDPYNTRIKCVGVGK